MNHRSVLFPLFLLILCIGLTLSAPLLHRGTTPPPEQSSAKTYEPLYTGTALCASLTAPTQQSASANLQYLLVGLDRQEPTQPARSDALILCSFCPEDNCLILTSFLRDLYVEIPGHGENRLNAAYAYGGRELLQKTMEHNFGILPDGCIEVDFSHFPEIIDLLDGIDLELRSDEAASVNASTGGTLTEGLQHLTGDQALAYARIRNLDADGDFSRTARQQNVLSAVLRRCREVSSLRLLSVVIKAIPMVSTDLDPRDLLSTASDLVPMLQDMSMEGLRIPADKTYRFASVRGMDVIVADLDAARDFLDKNIINR